MSRQTPLPLKRLKSASEDIDHTNDRADDHTDDLKAHIKPIKKVKSTNGHRAPLRITLALALAGIILGQWIYDEYQLSEFLEKREAEASNIVNHVMTDQRRAADELVGELDRFIQSRARYAEDFADEVTGFWFAMDHGDKPKETQQRIVINLFKRMVISEEMIQAQLRTSLATYQQQRLHGQDQLVNRLYLVMKDIPKGSLGSLNPSVNASLGNTVDLSLKAMQVTIPLAMLEGVIDVAITMAIEAALVSSGVATTGYFSFGIGFAASIVVGCVMDAFDDSDDRLEAASLEALKTFRRDVIRQLQKQLQRDLKKTKARYLVAAKKAARDQARHDQAMESQLTAQAR